jgi:hypothetical protein
MSDAKIAGAPSFPELVRQFFVDYLLNQRAISPNTIASYRDAMLLFLDFAQSYCRFWCTARSWRDGVSC